MYKKQFVALCRHHTSERVIDVDFLKLLVENHPRFESKLSGYIGFGFNERGDGFVAMFENPIRTEPFSFKTCIDGVFEKRNLGSRRGNPLARDVMKAFRTEISDQTERVRILGKKVGRGKDWHVGHDNENGDSFQAILSDFLSSTNIDCVDDIALVWSLTKWSNEYKLPFLADADLSKTWRDFHARRAKICGWKPHETI